MKEDGWENSHEAFMALKVVLHSLRDRLTTEEAVRLAAQLPILLRGYYFNGWSPAHKPVKINSKEEFLNYVSNELPYDPEFNPERVSKVAFGVLAKRISNGEIRDIKNMLSREFMDILPGTAWCFEILNTLWVVKHISNGSKYTNYKLLFTCAVTIIKNSIAIIQTLLTLVCSPRAAKYLNTRHIAWRVNCLAVFGTSFFFLCQECCHVRDHSLGATEKNYR
jgi:uncharacterized protein (DUF2267 family)